MTTNEALYTYTLRLADSGLILGHRLCEWCSNGPILEEDIAMSNLALDLMGRSNALLMYAAKVEGKNRTEDDLAYKRGERQFLNPLITELPNGDFGFTMVRQLLVSAFDVLLYEELSKSKDETIAGISAKSLKEVKYHFKHAANWVIRLGDGTQESHDRVQKSLHDIWAYTGDLFDMDQVDAIMIKEGIGVNLESLKPAWDQKVNAVIEEATLVRPKDAYMHTGSKKGLHTESLGFILAEMQYLQRAYPDAKW